MPDDLSELVPPLPIPNRTVKRLSADDSAQLPSVKVGHRQASIRKAHMISHVGFFIYNQRIIRFSTSCLRGLGVFLGYAKNY